MMKSHSDSSISEKWKNIINTIVKRNISYSDLCEKYFVQNVTLSTQKAIEANWIRILGFDYQIIVKNIQKIDQNLGLSLYSETQEINKKTYQRHFFRRILPNYCISYAGVFLEKDELLEVNGLKVQGLLRHDLINILKRVPTFFQFVVARKITNLIENDDCERGEIIDVADIDQSDIDDNLSKCSTLKSISSTFSTGSRDFGLSVSVDDLEQNSQNVSDYLRGLNGWRGPIIIEFRKKHRESLGLALDEILDPRNNIRIVVLKYVLRNMRADEDGRLHMGDRILQINGRSIDKVPYRKVCQWMKNAPRGKLVLQICKPHFQPVGIDNLATNNEEMYNHNIGRFATLPNLIERPNELQGSPDEVDNNEIEIAPIPDNLQRHIKIKRPQEPASSAMPSKYNNSNLGIYFGIRDGGKHGSIILKIVDGLAKKDGRVQSGDYVTEINGVNFRIDNRNDLNAAIHQVMINTDGHYEISFVSGEDVKIHKDKYLNTARKRRLSFRNPMVLNTNSDNGDATELDNPSLLSPDHNLITVEMPICPTSKLGLILAPSISDPDRFVTITDILPNSSASKCDKLKINDDIIAINEYSFVGIGLENAKVLLKTFLELEKMTLMIRRLNSNDMDLSYVQNKFSKLENLPDIYFCVLEKGPKGYGFAVKELVNGLGVILNELEKGGSASKVPELQPGDRFICIDNQFVCGFNHSQVTEIVKRCTKIPDRKLALLMERPKYAQFQVDITRKEEGVHLGLNVGGGMDCGIVSYSNVPIIDSVSPGHASEFSFPILPYDLIIAVEHDKYSLLGLTHSEAIQVLRKNVPPSPSVANLTIRRQLPWLAKKHSLYEYCYQGNKNSYPPLKDIGFIYPTGDDLQKVYTLVLSKTEDRATVLDGYLISDLVVVDNTSRQTQIVVSYKAISINPEIEDSQRPAVFNLSTTIILLSINGVKLDAALTNECVTSQILDNFKHQVILEVCIDIPHPSCSSYTAWNQDAPKDKSPHEYDSPILLTNGDIVSVSSSENEVNNNEAEVPQQAEDPIIEQSVNEENHVINTTENNEDSTPDSPNKSENRLSTNEIQEPLTTKRMSFNDEEPPIVTDNEEDGKDDNDGNDEPLKLTEILLTYDLESDWQKSIKLCGGKSAGGEGIDLPIYIQSNCAQNLIQNGDQLLAIDGTRVSPSKHSIAEIREMIGQPTDDKPEVKLTVVRFKR